MIGAAIRAILMTSTEITDKTTAIFPVMGVQEQPKPFIVYRRSVKDPAEAKGTNAYTINQGIEISIYSESYDEAEAIGEAVYNVMLSYSGETNGVRIQAGTQITSEEDFFSEPHKSYVLIQDYNLDYQKL